MHKKIFQKQKSKNISKIKINKRRDKCVVLQTTRNIVLQAYKCKILDSYHKINGYILKKNVLYEK